MQKGPKFLGLIALIVITISVAQSASAAAGVPKIIHYQGRLLDVSNNLLGGNGTDHCFRFSIYDDAVVDPPDNKLWPTGTPSTMTVNVKNGVFNVGIGDTSAGGDTLDFNFQDNDTVYLNVEVATKVGGTCAAGDGAESFQTVGPRQRIVSSGYTINASTVDGFTPSQYASGTQIPVLNSGNLSLGGTNPQINATGTNTLTLQGGGGTGDIQFFSSSNKITSAGALTLAGGITSNGLTISGAVAGGIFFANSSGALSQSSTALYWDNVNGRLGVGTNAPSTTIHIAGTGRFSSALTLDNGLTLTTGALNMTSTSGLVNLTLSSSTSAFNVNDFFEIDTTNNRIGIGTTAPGEKLEVVGNIISKGTSWTLRTSAANNIWTSVTYGNGLFVAIAGSGTGNRVMTSPDGITWTLRTSAADTSWASVTYGNGLFVAVSNSGTGNRVMTSPDGITWTLRTSAADNSWFSVTYGNGLFVAVAFSGTGNRVMTSPDGITWTLRTSAADNGWASVTYGNGLFVAVSNSGTGNRVMTSPDGITWTLRTSAADNGWRSVTYGNGLFVAVAETGTGNQVMTSPDGITWTLRTSAADNGWLSVTYGNGLFVAVSNSGTGNRVMTSPDGITWTSRTSAADNNWRSVTYGNGLFVAVAETGTGNRVMTSGKSELNALSVNNIYQGGMSIFGNVGIGTTSPGANLQITNAPRTVDVLRLIDAEGVAGAQTARIYFTAPIGGGPDLNIEAAGRVIFPGFAIRTNRIEVVTGGILTIAALGEFASPGAGIFTVGSLFNNTAAATGTGVVWDFNLNRLGTGKTAVAQMAGIITDIGDTTFKGELAFYTANATFPPTERVRINYLGNVGIGTTSPSTTLHVVGTGRISGTSTTAFQIQSSSTGLTFDSHNNRLGIGTATPTSTLHLGSDAGTAASGIAFGSTGDTNLYRSAADTLKTDDNFLIQTTTNSSTAFEVKSAAGTSTLVVDTTNTRVGIGTVSPLAKLTVQGAGGIGQSVNIDNREIKFRGDGDAHYSIFANRVAGTLTIEDTSSSGAIGTAGTVIMAFAKTTGRVGIGTTSPDAFLEIEGALGGGGIHLDSSTGAAILVDRGATANVYRLSFQTAGVDQWTIGNFLESNENLGIYVGTPVAGGAKVTIDTTGNVGIGTVSPSTTLDVVGTARFSATTTASNGLTLTTGALNMTSTSGLVNLTLSSSTTAFNVNNFFNVDTTNNRIGIGTIAPTSSLHLASDAGTAASGIAFGSTGDTNLYRSAADTLRTDDNFLVQTTTNSSTAFEVKSAAGTSTLVVDTINTRVGIGATPANALLTIGTNTTAASGGLIFGTDTNLYRFGVDELATDDRLTVFRTNTVAFRVANVGGTETFQVDTVNAQVFIGANSDTNLYRSAPNVLATDDSLQVGVFSTANSERLCWDAAGASLVTDCTGTPGDYAEEYGTVDSSVEPGDLVIPDSKRNAVAVFKDGRQGSKGWVLKAANPYEPHIIGVVSTDPNEVIGQNFAPEDNPRPITLSGRVPVKVSTENGAIAVGDPITSSNIPGVGMKTTHAGRIVGIALQSYDGQGIGKILVFVNPTWYLPPELTLAFEGGLTIEDGKFVIKNASSTEAVISFDNAGNAFFAGEVQAASIKANKISGLEIITNKISSLSSEVESLTEARNASSTTIGGLEVRGDASFLGELRASKIIAEAIESPDGTSLQESIRFLTSLALNASSTIDTLTVQLASSTAAIEKLNVNLADLTNRLTAVESQSGVSLTESIDGGLVINSVSILKGGLQVEKVSALDKEIAFMNDVVFFGRPYFTTDTAGFAVVKRGERRVEIVFEKEYIEKPTVNISISINGDDVDASNKEELILNGDIRYLVTKVSNQGFTILLNRLAPTDIPFSWTALAVKGAKTFTTIVPELVPPSPTPDTSSTTLPSATSTSSEPSSIVVPSSVVPSSTSTPETSSSPPVDSASSSETSSGEASSTEPSTP